MASESEDDISSVKPASKKAARPRAARKGAEATDTVTADEAPEGVAGVVLRKKALLERVQNRTSAKRKDVRDVVEATLLVLGEALAQGEELNLPPFGRAKVHRQKGVNGGDMYMVKLRRVGTDGDAPTDPLADAAE